MIDFGMDFLSVLAPFWNPSWDHAGAIFGWNGGAEIDSTHLFVALAFFSDFFTVLTPSWPHFGSILGPLGFILARFGKFLALCWHHFGATLGPLGARAGTGCAGLAGLREASRIQSFGDSFLLRVAIDAKQLAMAWNSKVLQIRFSRSAKPT